MEMSCILVSARPNNRVSQVVFTAKKDVKLTVKHPIENHDDVKGLDEEEE